MNIIIIPTSFPVEETEAQKDQVTCRLIIRKAKIQAQNNLTPEAVLLNIVLILCEVRGAGAGDGEGAGVGGAVGSQRQQ